MAERSIAAVLKTVVLSDRDRGFESLSLREEGQRRNAGVVERDRLEIGCAAKSGTGGSNPSFSADDLRNPFFRGKRRSFFSTHMPITLIYINGNRQVFRILRYN